MKIFRISLLATLLLAISATSIAQNKTEKIKVWGECGMCKNKIEKAAKEAGASFAEWNSESKELTVTYAASSNAGKIEKAVAAVGYDTRNVRASDETYSKLHSCCKYDRTATYNAKSDAKADCCKDGRCADCCKDGKCTAGADCCQDGKCDAGKDCCKEGKCEHHAEGSAAKESHGKKA